MSTHAIDRASVGKSMRAAATLGGSGVVAESPAALSVNWREPAAMRVTRCLLVGVGVLLVAHFLCGFMASNVDIRFQPKVYRLFWFSGEFGFPAWFSAMMLAAAGVLLLLITGQRRLREWSIWPTFVLGAGFFLMSADELLQLHEETVYLVTRRWFPNAGEYARTWTAGGALLALVVGLAMIPMLRRLPRLTCWLFLAAGATYLGGALGLEALSGLFEDPEGPLYSRKIYILVMTAEETCEKLGVILFLHALIAYYAALLRDRGWMPHTA